MGKILLKGGTVLSVDEVTINARPGQTAGFAFAGGTGKHVWVRLSDVTDAEGFPSLAVSADDATGTHLGHAVSPDEWLDLGALPHGGTWRVVVRPQDALVVTMTLSIMVTDATGF